MMYRSTLQSYKKFRYQAIFFYKNFTKPQKHTIYYNLYTKN
ncbi:MAG: hypothetical protein KatS3mg033_0035 [Thermonema sp.]|nr:MAG: hypothetical protein KatS3mg033_0035 [Thermonema sp.]